MDKIKCIIPSAGLGSRMKMKPHEAKEMLIDPSTHAPLIDYSLNICRKYDLEPVVISRKEKQELNKYLVSKDVSLIVLPEIEGEWMDTVLKSSPLWSDNNILLLPDTRFEPISIIQEIKNSLELGAKSAIGLHSVTDPAKWCIVDNYSLLEKPQIIPNGCDFFAFGVLGFKATEGYNLLSGLSEKKQAMLKDASFHYFSSFKDLTRTGKVE